MGDFDLYRSRVVSIREGRINTTKTKIKNNFIDSPSYFPAKRGSEDVNIWLYEKSSQSSRIDFIKGIVVEPGKTLTLGEVFIVGSDKWLCIEIDPLHEVYYKGNVRLCNQTLTLVTSTTRIQTGTDSLGRPIYSETPVLTSWDCIAESKVVSADLNSAINLPEGKIYIQVPYSALIQENMEFDMWNAKFKITGFDMSKVIDGIGLLGIYAERVVS